METWAKILIAVAVVMVVAGAGTAAYLLLGRRSRGLSITAADGAKVSIDSIAGSTWRGGFSTYTVTDVTQTTFTLDNGVTMISNHSFDSVENNTFVSPDRRKQLSATSVDTLVLGVGPGYTGTPFADVTFTRQTT